MDRWLHPHKKRPGGYFEAPEADKPGIGDDKPVIPAQEKTGSVFTLIN